MGSVVQQQYGSGSYEDVVYFITQKSKHLTSWLVLTYLLCLVWVCEENVKCYLAILVN